MGTIAEKLTYLEGTKSAIKDAIIAKGVEVTDTDTFRSYAEKIESIEAGGSCESQSKEINITDNGTIVVTPDEGYLLDQVTVNTNITTGKPVLPNGISFDGSTWTTFDTDPYDWSQIYSGTEMFASCTKLQTLTGTGIENVYFLDLFETFLNCNSLTEIPKLYGRPTTISGLFDSCRNLDEVDLSGLDWSDLADISYAFRSCKEWVQNIDFRNSPIRMAESAYRGSSITQLPLINYALLENVDYMFMSTYLTSANLDFQRVISASQLFYKCYALEEVHFNGMKFNESLNGMFYSCENLTTITGLQCENVKSSLTTNTFFNCSKLKNIDGLFNLGESFTGSATINLYHSPLTRESCLNIFNTIYDFIGNGSKYRATLDLHQDVLAQLSEEDIAIATAKGWTIK